MQSLDTRSSQTTEFPRTETGSSLATWRTCRRLYEFKYEERLQSKGYSSSLAFGTFVHAEVEAVNGHRDSTLPRIRDEYLAEYPDQMERIEFDAHLARAIVPIWKRYWDEAPGTHSNRHLQFNSVEAEWSFPVGRDQLAGKRDGDLTHTGLKRDFLYELKTASSSGGSNYTHRLLLNDQISNNILALRQAGKEVDAVFYDIIWKHQLRQKKDEALTDFMARIVADYETHRDQYFERLIVTQSMKHLGRYRRELMNQMFELKELDRYRNPSACMTYGNLCEFFNLCVDDDVPELRSQFKVKPRKHMELNNAAN